MNEPLLEKVTKIIGETVEQMGWDNAQDSITSRIADIITGTPSVVPQFDVQPDKKRRAYKIVPRDLPTAMMVVGCRPVDVIAAAGKTAYTNDQGTWQFSDGSFFFQPKVPAEAIRFEINLSKDGVGFSNEIT